MTAWPNGPVTPDKVTWCSLPSALTAVAETITAQQFGGVFWQKTVHVALSLLLSGSSTPNSK